MINIDDLTTSSLRFGKFERELPEYYELKKKRENNGWHQTEESIFEHCVNVFDQLDLLKDLKFLKEDIRKKITIHLDFKIDNFSKRQLLKVATLLHDIAKGMTWVRSNDGTTRCPGHEIIGNDMVPKFKSRFELSEDEISIVRNIVLHHQVVHEFASLAGKTEGKLEYLYDVLKEYVGDELPEVLLLVYADIRGCDVIKTDPEEFRSRSEQVVKWLEN